ncbi:MAG: hypothetical protein DLM58_15720 [Pseudonocardiales bacterium]|nr:MAG: hypothetical protein DLM58_15720 [Pseudonocardiales bacterium]
MQAEMSVRPAEVAARVAAPLARAADDLAEVHAMLLKRLAEVAPAALGPCAGPLSEFARAWVEDEAGITIRAIQETATAAGTGATALAGHDGDSARGMARRTPTAGGFP